jgi:Flp pilus assembly protein TadG
VSGARRREKVSRRQRLLAAVRREDGQAFVLFAVAAVAVFAFASFAVDIGRVIVFQRKLQASADAAGLAAAVDLPNATAAAAHVAAYGSGSGGKNAIPGLAVTVTPTFKCVTSIGQGSPQCVLDPSKPNAIVVTEHADVPLLFGGVIGWSSMAISASSTALVQGGSRPLDIMLVMDTTASMSAACGASVPGIASPSKLQCAKAGAQALLTKLRPGVDKVGLAIFPPLKQGVSIAPEFTTNCSATWGITSSNLSYATTSTYTIAPLSSDFLRSDKSLNPTSNLVRALNYAGGAAGSSKGCGLESPGGVSTYFPDAIKRAQIDPGALNSDPSPHVGAIVFLSDGQGNTSANGDTTPCQNAIANAAGIKATGTFIYAIGYWESQADSLSPPCSSNGYTGYNEMQAIAGTPSSEFFYAYYNGSSDTLTDIFAQIGQDLMKSARLVPDNTP